MRLEMAIQMKKPSGARLAGKSVPARKPNVVHRATVRRTTISVNEEESTAMYIDDDDEEEYHSRVFEPEDPIEEDDDHPQPVVSTRAKAKGKGKAQGQPEYEMAVSRVVAKPSAQAGGDASSLCYKSFKVLRVRVRFGRLPRQIDLLIYIRLLPMRAWTTRTMY